MKDRFCQIEKKTLEIDLISTRKLATSRGNLKLLPRVDVTLFLSTRIALVVIARFL